MTPYSLEKLHWISQFLPPHIIARECVVLIQAVSPKSLGNYSTGLLRFTQFCDQFNIPESLRMPLPEWLLSHFITTRGTGSVGPSSLWTWLLGLKLWHVLNSSPWHGSAHLKHASQGSKKCAQTGSFLLKHAPVTLAHLQALWSNLNLNDTFDAAVFAVATIAFWCQCHISEVCMEQNFDASIHAHNTPQKSGQTVSSILFHSFLAP